MFSKTFLTQTQQREIVGAVLCSIADVRPVKGKNKKKTKTEMVECIEERLCKCVQNYKHIYDVTSPGHRDRELLQNSWEEIGCELRVQMQRRNSEVNPELCTAL